MFQSTILENFVDAGYAALKLMGLRINQFERYHEDLEELEICREAEANNKIILAMYWLIMAPRGWDCHFWYNKETGHHHLICYLNVPQFYECNH